MALHHIENVWEFFTDAYALLEPQGTLVIADLYKEDGSFHQHITAFNGHNGFDVNVLSELAERAGFTVDKIEPYHEIWQENFEGIKVSYPLFLFVARKLI